MRSSGRGHLWRPRALAITLLLVPAVGGADEVHLEGGGVVRGVIVEETADAVVLETGPGRVTLRRSRISRVVEGRSSLATFRQRASAVIPGDVEALVRLARWAEDHALATQARETWRRVLALDAEHPEANAALGRTLLGGVWMEESEAYRARGYVRYGDRWVTPAEHEALVRQSESEALAARGRREAEIRVREAEARAREAEARAREAEARAEQAEGVGDGIPYWWVLAGGGGPLWLPGAGHSRPPGLRPGPPGVRSPRGPSDTPTGTIREPASARGGHSVAPRSPRGPVRVGAGTSRR